HTRVFRVIAGLWGDGATTPDATPTPIAPSGGVPVRTVNAFTGTRFRALLQTRAPEVLQHQVKYLSRVAGPLEGKAGLALKLTRSPEGSDHALVRLCFALLDEAGVHEPVELLGGDSEHPGHLAVLNGVQVLAECVMPPEDPPFTPADPNEAICE